MNKTTIVLDRSKHIQGYVYIGGPSYSTDSQSTLDALVKWSALPENKDRIIVKHYVRTQEEPREGGLEYHYASENGWSQEECAKLFKERAESKRAPRDFEGVNVLTEACSMVYRTPIVDEVHYLDIYYQ